MGSGATSAWESGGRGEGGQGVLELAAGTMLAPRRYTAQRGENIMNVQYLFISHSLRSRINRSHERMSPVVPPPPCPAHGLSRPPSSARLGGSRVLGLALLPISRAPLRCRFASEPWRDGKHAPA